MTEAVEQRLRSDERRGDKPARRKLAGRLASMRSETARVGRRIDDEFEQLEPEDWD